MIVVDTNTIAYLYLEGQHSKQAEYVLQRDPIWAAPLLWRSEFRNVLALYLRKKIIPYRDAVEILEQAETLMRGNEYAVASTDILELVKHSKCSAYDCEFISLSKSLGISLVTEDKKILTEFPNNAVSLHAFCKEN